MDCNNATKSGQKITIHHGEARRLVLAIVARALRDACGVKECKGIDRVRARQWLLEGGAADWLSIVGAHISQGEITNFVNTNSGPGGRVLLDNRGRKKATSERPPVVPS